MSNLMRSKFKTQIIHLLSSYSRDFTTCSKILFPHKEEVSKSKFSDTNSTLEFVEEKKKEVEIKRQTYLSQSNVDEKRSNTKKYADDLEAEFNEMSEDKALEKKAEERAAIIAAGTSFINEVKDDLNDSKEVIKDSRTFTEHSKQIEVEKTDDYLNDIIRENDQQIIDQLEALEIGFNYSKHGKYYDSPLESYDSSISSSSEKAPESKDKSSQDEPKDKSNASEDALPESKDKSSQDESKDKGSLLDDYANLDDQPMDYFGGDD